MREALAYIRQSDRSLLQFLEEVTGRQLTPELLREYKKYYLFELKILYGVNAFDLDQDRVNTDAMTDLIETQIPVEVCTRFKLMPLEILKGDRPSVLVAMVDPNNLESIDELKRILERKNLGFQRRVITLEDYQKLLDKFYNKQAQKQEQKQKQKLEKLFDVSEIVENLNPLREEEREEDDDELGTLDEGNEAPVIKLVNKIIIKALQQNVSHIHIEPQEDNLRIRFRKDRVLNEGFSPLPKGITQAVVNRLKVMAELEIGQKRTPQQGKIRRIFQGQKVDLRMTVLPGRYGEKVVLRVFNQSATRLNLDGLIIDKNTLSKVREMCQSSFGLILVTAPAYGGKSTTLYSLLAELNNQKLNISTIEDSIEYYLPGINQFQLVSESETNQEYTSIMEFLLLQDVDVVMIEQIQEETRAKKAVEAAMSCLVLAGLVKTTDAATPITRLLQMGIEPSILADTLVGVINQRLIRRVCSKCRISCKPTTEELARYGLSPTQVSDGTFYRAKTLTNIEIAKTREIICSQCEGMGYLGQVGVYEVLQMSDRLRTLIADRPDSKTLIKFAIEEGMITLSTYAQNLVIQGYTTFEELQRVFGENYLLQSTQENRKTNDDQQQKLATQIKVLTNELQQIKQMINSGSITSTQALQNTEAIAAFFQKQEQFNKQFKVLARHLQQLKQQVDADSISPPLTLQNYETIPDPW